MLAEADVDSEADVLDDADVLDEAEAEVNTLSMFKLSIE